jgi:hypothetical protein
MAAYIAKVRLHGGPPVVKPLMSTVPTTVFSSGAPMTEAPVDGANEAAARANRNPGKTLTRM